MSILVFFNYWVFQWFFFRLAKVTDDQTGEFIKWKIIKVFPLTGWDSDYRYW